MGKGFNNYMCKKPFHPGSKDNIKRTWMAEQKSKSEQLKQEELRNQYEKEQDLYNNKILVSKESKEKLSLNFMYEAPAGAKKHHEREDDEPEYKFEWQRKFNAPREDYAKGNEDIQDQPFGIQVRNVRCIRCHKWGHVNTDRECPLFEAGTMFGAGVGMPKKADESKAEDSEEKKKKMNKEELMEMMREEEGLKLKQSVLDRKNQGTAANQQLIEGDSDVEADNMASAFLQTLSEEQKLELLRKLTKASKKKKSKKSRIANKTRSKEKSHKRDRKSKRDRSSSESSDSETRNRSAKRHRRSRSCSDDAKRSRKHHESKTTKGGSSDSDARGGCRPKRSGRDGSSDADSRRDRRNSDRRRQDKSRRSDRSKSREDPRHRR